MHKIRGLLLGYLLIAMLCGWPVLSVAIAGGIANWNGCTLHEGNVTPCVVNGVDLGGTLYTMGVMGWFMIATVPIGLLSLVLWTVAWFIWRMVKRRQAAAVPGSP